MRKLFARPLKDTEKIGHLAEDIDLAIADRFGVDPFVVNHVWPADLRDRAISRMDHEGRRAEAQSRKRQREDKRTNRKGRRSGRSRRRGR